MKKNKIFLLVFIFISIFSLNANADEDFLKNKDVEIIASYDNKIPSDVTINLKYTQHPNVYDYVFITARSANLRKTPETNSESNIIGKYTYDSKLKILKKIKYQGNFWYYAQDEKGTKGYIAASVVAKRNFRFQMALDKIHSFENFVNASLNDGYRMASTNTYAPNPNHENLSWERDKYGTSIDQNLIGTSDNGEKIIIPDRSVIRIIKDMGDTVKVKALSIPEELTIPKSKITSYPNIKKGFRKVIAIDLQNQNFMVFEKVNNEWQVISYVYSKTGIDSQLGFETPKGFFTVPTVKYVMAYNDENGQKQGSARFAIRFSGGGYIHGTPINEQEEVNREFFMRQKEFTLGTTTGTRKCVRTTEGNAKFLFDWLVKNPNKSSNEQHPTEDAYVIVF
ncbi:MAG: L,D-transpeptidase [Fusobacterium gastrosuis]|uniref:L,D-transpeptidase family protein n=1 Tax=Fusobacterium gastrosuis TaxID=1755100 RepID=UPI002A9F2D83|nr:L,D-transpeptidase [Fusobacteriaceae bacterium]MDY5795091.1 L,D-transpeptidase [Fusobacterium gastrosuis]